VRHKQLGAAMVEFALVMPFLLILTFIATEYGRALYQYNTLTKSIRDAARYLSVQTPGDSTKFATAKNLAVYGNPAGTGTPLAYGLSVSQIPDPTWQLQTTTPVIKTVTIQIGYGAAGTATRYKFVPLVSNAFGVSFGTIEFAPISATMRTAL
jgi:Flp pilus assembly protein TadG